MKTKLAALLITVLLTGCATMQKLPPIDADAITYERHDPIGGTVIQAKNVRVNDAAKGSLTADEVEWTTTYPQFGVHIKVLGYRQNQPTK